MVSCNGTKTSFKISRGLSVKKLIFSELLELSKSPNVFTRILLFSSTRNLFADGFVGGLRHTQFHFDFRKRDFGFLQRHFMAAKTIKSRRFAYFFDATACGCMTSLISSCDLISLLQILLQRFRNSLLQIHDFLFHEIAFLRLEDVFDLAFP